MPATRARAVNGESLDTKSRFDPPAFSCRSTQAAARLFATELLESLFLLRGQVCFGVGGIASTLFLGELDSLARRNAERMRTFQVSGNPDVPFVGDGFVLVSTGCQGLIRFEQ